MDFFQISKAIVFEVSGGDVVRYCNARLTNNIKLQPLNTVLLAAQLTPQGKTEGLFRVYRTDAERFILECDGGEVATILAAFKKYIVADRVSVVDRSSELRVLHLLPKAINILGVQYPEIKSLESGKLANLTGGVIASRQMRTPELGIDLIAESELSGQIEKKLKTSGLQQGSDLELNFARLSAGQAAYPEEINEDTVFLESGLKEALSFSKGCYVGQEVIEKVESVGRLAKGLCLLESDLPITSEQNIKSLAGVNLGRVLSSASSLGKHLAFASLRNSGISNGDPVIIECEGGKTQKLKVLRILTFDG